MVAARGFAFALSLLLIACPVFGQGISGRVLDYEGRAKPNVRVTASLVAASSLTLKATTETDSEGRFAFPKLPPNVYIVEVASVDGLIARRSVPVTTGEEAVVFDFTAGKRAEPPSLLIEQLFEEADAVALVQVQSGDDERYPIAVFKAKVLTAYKGTNTGAAIWFGPCDGREVGGEYLVFLYRGVPPVPLAANSGESSLTGPSPFFTEMLQGLGTLETGFVCVFGNPNPCADGVRLSWHVELPRAIKLFGLGSGGVHPGSSWAHKGEVLALVQKLSEKSRNK
jgi:hypothetical protein